MIFFYGDRQSAKLIKDTLHQFYDLTGLCANNSKSCLFMAGVTDDVGEAIKLTLQFSLGSLPLKYLGVPLITTRLRKSDCRELTKKISSRIVSWNSKFLSYAGRAQLVNSVIMGIHNYWATMFVLPKGLL